MSCLEESVIWLHARAWGSVVVVRLHGGVEGVDEGCGDAEAANDFASEGGIERGVGGEDCVNAPTLGADEFVCGIVVGEALGHACEGVALAECEGVGAGFQELLEGGAIGLVMFAHPAAEGEQLFALGHVDAGGDHDFLRADLEVEASAGGLLHAAARPPGGEVGFVGQLIFAEADVAIDAHGDFVGRTDVVGGEVDHAGVDFVDEGEHGGFDGALVEGAAGLEPVAVVVAGEAAEELEGFGGEDSGHGSSMRREDCGAQRRKRRRWRSPPLGW
jgi:hypothetical protein